ncbi:hypothetical protein ACU4GH_14770, partial [Bradyrhizobium betae]
VGRSCLGRIGEQRVVELRDRVFKQTHICGEIRADIGKGTLDLFVAAAVNQRDRNIGEKV